MKKNFTIGQKVSYSIMPGHTYHVVKANQDGTYDIADGSYKAGSNRNEGGSRINNVDSERLTSGSWQRILITVSDAYWKDLRDALADTSDFFGHGRLAIISATTFDSELQDDPKLNRVKADIKEVLFDNFVDNYELEMVDY